ncbi:DEAD/DEAH box helicase family protein [Bavariicoccus seileri]|uniref:DEAD/DEAH box helicase family protein n=1 Tax=Bavariicoccus seileri TaxID=549685 RepID=UPI0003B6B505|nr:DUF3427 domain-containing protein [Bavariicoccus seileri]
MNKGLYERLIDEKLDHILSKVSGVVERGEVEKEELPYYLADQLKKLVLDKLINADEKDRVHIFNRLSEQIRSDAKINETAKEILLKEIRDQNDNKKSAPESKLVEPLLFTGRSSSTFPNLASEFKKEIQSSDEIDLIISFVKVGGLNIILEALKNFTRSGGKLRLLTTTYMGASDLKAIQQIARLPNTRVKISYNFEAVRLHAKTYIFKRKTGFSTAYIGSSNLSKSAITTGREWNVKVTNAKLPALFQQLTGEFDLFWNNEDFEDYDVATDSVKLQHELKRSSITQTDQNPIAYFDIRPFPYQQKILDDLTYKRNNGVYKNLIVMATGTGKTVVAALDFKRFKQEHRNSRLLFIAHSIDITKQALATLRQILHDQNFGELLDGKNKPLEGQNIFATIQTFDRITEQYPKDYFDYIIIDEAHHTGAKFYWNTLDDLEPKILLGLTATPDRMDGFDILGHFDHQISAELNLFDAIEEEYLVPFQYFGVTDSVDLASLDFKAGDYDLKQLSDALSNDVRINTVVSSLDKYTPEIKQLKAIGFCVDQKHARYMAEAFNRLGYKATYLVSDGANDRDQVKHDLESGKVNFVFTVNMYNEGVDIPDIDTVLFLRPTQSKTIFLQQLGRGLRRSEGKEYLTVLDFIGGQHARYNYQMKFRALIQKGSVKKAVEDDFPYVPAGSVITLEPVAKKIVLENIKKQSSGKKWFREEIKQFKQNYDAEPTLKNIVEKLEVTPTEIYKELLDKNTTLSDLRFGKQNQSVRYSFVFKNTVDSNNKQSFDLLLNSSRIGEDDYRFLYATYFSNKPKGVNKRKEVVKLLENSNAHLVDEFRNLIDYKLTNDQVVEGIDQYGFTKYGTYTNAQIMSRLPGMENVLQHTSGVLNVKKKNIEVLFITLEKTEKDFSPLTMYQDYIVNRNKLHWEGPHNRGQKYAHDLLDRKAILLFVRKNKSSNNYYYLGASKPGEITGEFPIQTYFTFSESIPRRIYEKLL